MSLRARLTAALLLTVTLPVLAAAVVLLLVLPANARHRVDAQVSTARSQAAALLQADCATDARLATTLAAAPATGAAADAAVTAAASTSGSAAALLGADGAILASAARAGKQAGPLTAQLRSAPDCVKAATAAVAGTAGARVLAARAARSDGGTAVVGIALDPALAGDTASSPLQRLRQETGADVTLVVPAASGTPTHVSTLADDATAARIAASVSVTGSVGAAGVGRAVGVTYAAVALPDGTRLVLSRPAPGVAALAILVVALALLVLLLGGLVAWRAARMSTRPLGELSHAAERVTHGDLEFSLPVHGEDEVGRLAVAFNTMTEALRRTITDLRTSRDELQRNVSRLGDTLAGTHDLDRILGVIVDTAMVSVRATAGALLLTAASGDVLYLRVGRGLEGRLFPATTGTAANRPVRLSWQPGEPGVAARAVLGDAPVIGRVGVDGVTLAADEPAASTVLATPLRSGGRVTGVLVLYDRGDGQPFDDRDLQIVDSFTSQAVTAVDNVLLHQEAQRLSITDGLTGLWNYRYAIIALTREVERATRFQRPLTVLMLDLDRFKRVNDRFGHQRGDAVLLEVANRVRTVVREVDILARYGGEELILVAPETDLGGAETLATKVRDAIRSTPFGAAGEVPLQMTTSIGIAVYPLHGDSARDLLRAADSALYAAKAAGRDCWRVAPPPRRGPAVAGRLPEPDAPVPSTR